MTLYNTTQLQTVVTVYDMFKYANDSTNNLFTGLVMMAIFFIMVMSLNRFGFLNSLSASSYVCFILSLILRYTLLISFWYPAAFLAIAAFTTFYMYTNSS